MARGRHESQVVRDVRGILGDVDPARLRHEGLDRTLSPGSDVLEEYVGPGLVVARTLLEGEDVDHALSCSTARCELVGSSCRDDG